MYIAIEGVIGVGKTTLARLLRPMLEAEILLEIFEENPFLSDFYADRARYAFQTQIFFLLSRYHQQRRTVPDLLAAGKSLLSDYTFAKDALFARINLKGDELEMYYKVHEALGEKIPKPDLIVYLRADTEALMQRIASRDRPYERNMERDYIDLLNRAYEEFFSKAYDGPPVLTDRHQPVEHRPESGASQADREPHPGAAAVEPLSAQPAAQQIGSMRVTRQSLVRIAKETTQERVYNDRTIVAAYLTGSLVGEADPMLGGTADIDLVLVHDGPPSLTRQIVKLTPDFHLDIRHRSAVRFQVAARAAHGPRAGLGTLRSHAAV